MAFPPKKKIDPKKVKEMEVAEENETPEDEAKETPEYQEAEDEAGVEKHDTESADVPESFQLSVKKLMSQCANNKACLNYVRDIISQKEMDLMKPEKPVEFSTEDMPD